MYCIKDKKSELVLYYCFCGCDDFWIKEKTNQVIDNIEEHIIITNSKTYAKEFIEIIDSKDVYNVSKF